MPTLKPIAKHSTYAPLMDLEVLPNTPSFAQMEPSSTKSTSSVIGGLTSIAQKPKAFILWMKTLLLNVKPQLLRKETKDLPHPHKDLMPPQAEEPEVKLHTKAEPDVEGSKA